MNTAKRRSALAATRGVLFAASSATLAVTAHVVAEGDLPNLALTMLLTVLMGWLGIGLAGKNSGPVSTVAILGLAQLGMHLILSELASHSAGSASGTNALAMIAAHSLATILTALLLSFAESMIAAAVATLRLIWPISWRPQPIAELAILTLSETPLKISALSTLLSRVHGRRGPPLFS